jgi:hypothetical protein
MLASFLVRMFFWLWFGAAIATGHFLVLQRTPPLAMHGIIVGLVALIVFAYLRVAAVRQWVDALDLRALVLLHVTRFLGIYLLVLYQRGELPRAFALPGGMTDILVATMALPVALAPIDEESRHRAIVIWNTVGLVGILLSLVTVLRINLADPSQLRALTHLPLSLLPTLLMPLMIATHVIIFIRTRVK